MTTLYEIAADYRDMAARLADLDLPDDVVADTLEAEGGELQVKASNVGFVCRNLEASAAAIKDAEAQMAARRKALENRAARLRAYLLDSMTLAGVEKIESPYFAIAIRKNPPSLEVLDEAQVPTGYFTSPPPPPPALDRKLILTALKEGVDVPGCRIKQGRRVDIK